MGDQKTFDAWYAEFARGKKEVSTNEQSDSYALHSIRRFMEDGNLWEIAFTYTGRLVMRTGWIDPDGIRVSWMDWQTLHDVLVPDHLNKN